VTQGGPLRDGARVAVVGAGPAGCTAAIACLADARSRGVRVDVLLYQGSSPRAGTPRAALVGTRGRLLLARMGIAVPPGVRLASLQGAAVRAGARAAVRKPGALELLTLDDATGLGLNGSLRRAAVSRGADLVERWVDDVSPQGRQWAIRAGGACERVDAVIGAFGPSSTLSARFAGSEPPPTWQCHYGEVLLRSDARARMRAILRCAVAPAPGVRALWIAPAPWGASVLAVGTQCDDAQLEGALMALAAEGGFPAAFCLRSARHAVLPVGCAGAPQSDAVILAGAAAFGRALRPALLLDEALLSGDRSGAALAAFGRDRVTLEQLYWTVTCRPRALAARREWLATVFLGMVAAIPGLGRALAAVVRRESASRRNHRCARALWELAAGGARVGRALRSALHPRTMAAVTLAWMRQAFASSRRRLPRRPLVYVVDDDPDVREALRQLLGEAGVPARLFSGPGPLLATAHRDRPAAVLLDVVLSAQDGLSVCRALKRHLPEVRVILMSALWDPAFHPRAADCGADGYLAKPFGGAELMKVLPRLPPPAPGGPYAASSSR
jgi:CheY-like chemotaxis protein